jgi:hypothetical protein
MLLLRSEMFRVCGRERERGIETLTVGRRRSIIDKGERERERE